MKFVRIGTVSGAYSLEGWLKVTPVTEHPELLEDIEYLLLAEDKTPSRSIKIEERKVHGGLMLFKCENINSDKDVKQLCNLSVVVPENMLPDTDEGEVYWYMIDGSKVVDTNGLFIGNLEDYIETGSSDVFRIKLEDGSFALISNNKSHVIEICPEKKQIVINREGLVSEDV